MQTKHDLSHHHGKYIQGYDEIILLHNAPKIAQEVVQSLLGMIIEQHCSTKTVYKSVIAVPEDNFEAVVKRATYLFLQQTITLVAIAAGESELNR